MQAVAKPVIQVNVMYFLRPVSVYDIAQERCADAISLVDLADMGVYHLDNRIKRFLISVDTRHSVVPIYVKSIKQADYKSDRRELVPQFVFKIL